MHALMFSILLHDSTCIAVESMVIALIESHDHMRLQLLLYSNNKMVFGPVSRDLILAGSYDMKGFYRKPVCDRRLI